MKVIIKEDMQKLGKAGQIVEVAAGYARNFLIPKGKVLEATNENLKLIEGYKRSQAKELEKEKQVAVEMAEKIARTSCTIVVEAHDDQLYGTVTELDIAKALKQEGITVDKKNILLEEPIETLGVYQVDIKLHPEVKQQVKVWVVKK